MWKRLWTCRETGYGMDESFIQGLGSYCTEDTCQQYRADTIAVNLENPRELVNIPHTKITVCLIVKYGGIYIYIYIYIYTHIYHSALTFRNFASYI